MGLFTLGAHRIRGRGVGSSLGPLFLLLFTNVVEGEFSEVRAHSPGPTPMRIPSQDRIPIGRAGPYGGA